MIRPFLVAMVVRYEGNDITTLTTTFLRLQAAGFVPGRDLQAATQDSVRL